MQAATLTAPVGNAGRWAGRILTGLAVSFLLVDIVVKILMLPVAVDATTELGYPASAVVTLGILELTCVAIHLIPRTAIVGALLLTGYLGGAVASQLRAGHPLFTHVLFPVYVAALIWGGLFLRDRRLRVVVATPA